MNTSGQQLKIICVGINILLNDAVLFVICKKKKPHETNDRLKRKGFYIHAFHIMSSWETNGGIIFLLDPYVESEAISYGIGIKFRSIISRKGTFDHNNIRYVFREWASM